MSKKLTFYKKYIQSSFFPVSKADFLRKNKYSIKIYSINIHVFSAMVGVLIRKLVSEVAVMVFEYSLGRFLEVITSTFITILIVNPLNKKMLRIKNCFYANCIWFISYIVIILSFIKIFGTGNKKIEQITE